MVSWLPLQAVLAAIGDSGVRSLGPSSTGLCQELRRTRTSRISRASVPSGHSGHDHADRAVRPLCTTGDAPSASIYARGVSSCLPGNAPISAERNWPNCSQTAVTQVVSPIVAAISRAVLAAATCAPGRGSLSGRHGQMPRKLTGGQQSRTHKVKYGGQGDQKGTAVDAELV